MKEKDLRGHDFVVGYIHDIGEVEKTPHGDKLYIHMNVWKTGFAPFEYESGLIKVVLYKDKIQQLRKASARKGALLEVYFKRHQEEKDEYENTTHAVMGAEIRKTTESLVRKLYCTNTQGQYDPFTRLVS